MSYTHTQSFEHFISSVLHSTTIQQKSFLRKSHTERTLQITDSAFTHAFQYGCHSQSIVRVTNGYQKRCNFKHDNTDVSD